MRHNRGANVGAEEDGERGCITMTASVAAQDAQIGQVVYGSAKAGVNGLVLPMARDLMNIGIRVNSIMPGIFATPLMLGAPQPVLDSLAASVPFPKRLGKPEEFASLAAGTARKRPEKVKEYLRRVRTSLTSLSSDTGPKPIGD